MTDRPTPPIAARKPHSVTRHGVTMDDPYHWMRVDDWQEVMRDPSLLDAEVRAYLEAENAYTETVLSPVKDLRRRLYEEMRGRIKEDDSSVPAPDGPWEYYLRFVEGGDYPLLCRRPRGGEGAEQVLLDGNAEAEGKPYFRLGAAEHSPDHRLFAVAEDLAGAEYFTLRVKDLESGALLPDTVTDVAPNVVWANDGRTLYYTRYDEHHRPNQVYRHILGTGEAGDELIYEEDDPGFFVGIGKTADDRFVVIESHDHSDTTEVRLVDADPPDAAPVLFARRESGVSYSVESHGDRFFILTNAGDAEDFKIAECPLDRTGREQWRDVLAHRPGSLVLSIALFRGHLVRLEREDALPRIVIRRLFDGVEHAIAFDEEAYALGVVPGYEFDTTSLRFSYASPTTPARTYDYDMESRERVLRKEQEVPSGHDPDDYVTRRLHVPGHDGAQVPVTVLYRKGTRLDGSAPCLLYGYGSYGITHPAGFMTNILSLVDRGFVFALAHVRGGRDRGHRWYLDGKLMNKRNTFADFIAAAEHLIAERYTAAGRIAIEGGSAGGMLVGACANMRPDLWGAVIAQVPFVDVINTMCDETLPLTPPEWVEWGNPIEDTDAFRYMLSYSPYDNVTAQGYPPMIVTSGVSDPRVTYWEPTKWVAKLRALKTDDNPLLLYTNLEAGHGGASGRFERLEEEARVFAFVLMVFGMAGEE